MYSNYSFRHFR